MSTEGQRCLTCGHPAGAGYPQPIACGHCPPTTCEVCGGINHLATDRSCSCWVSLEGMRLADVKALLARDADLSNGPTLGV